MNELELKYGCNPNQKPARVFMKNGAALPFTVLNGKPGYINLLDAFNSWQHPSVQVFLELMSRYHISVDQILHGETMEGKSTERMQFETLLDELTDAEIKILTATAQALLDARTDNEGEN